jgi:predicted membrane protein
VREEVSALPTPARGGARGALRAFSLLAALALSGLILTYPKALVHANHGLLSLVMLGVSAGFVHGVGFVPQHKLWRIVFAPWLAWPLMGTGLWLLLAN